MFYCLFDWNDYHCPCPALWDTQGLSSWYSSVLSPPEGRTHNPECVTLENVFEIHFYNELVLELCFLPQVPQSKRGQTQLLGNHV